MLEAEAAVAALELENAPTTTPMPNQVSATASQDIHAVTSETLRVDQERRKLELEAKAKP